MNLALRKKKIIEEFSKLDSWEKKYQKIIDLGKNLKDLDPKYKKEENLVSGCQSVLWLHCEFKNGKIYFSGDSEALISRGLLALMLFIYSDSLASEIVESSELFIEKIGFKDHLSPSRTNGVYSLIKKMKYYAIAYLNK